MPLFRALVLFFALSGILRAETNIVIRHTPVTKFAYPGEPIRFRAAVLPVNCSVSSVTLMVKPQGEPYYTVFLEMRTNLSGTNYTACLTNAQSTKNSLEYRIMAENNFHDKVLLPADRNYICGILPCEEARIGATSGGELVLPDDLPEDGTETSLDVPEGALFSDGLFGIEYYSLDSAAAFMDMNGYTVRGSPGLADGSVPHTLYRFYLKEEGEKRAFSFRRKADIRLRYFTGAPPPDEDRLALFFWDGLFWRGLEGVQDKTRKMFSFSSDHITLFGIFEKNALETASGSSRVLGYVARPSFAPLKGEVAVFGIKSAAGRFRIRILNMKGSLVRELDTASWDGRDGNGDHVPAGVYVYQIRSDAGNASGMLCVMK